MSKDNIREILLSMKTPENDLVVSRLLKLLDRLSEEELQLKLQSLNIQEENIEQSLRQVINEHSIQEEPSSKFIPVNELFCYGRTENTVHMHLIPKDLRDLKRELGDEGFYNYFRMQLEDFLSRLQVIVREDPKIESLFAVSPIFYNSYISAIHEGLGFDKITEIDLNNESDSMSREQKEKFLNMFNKDGSHSRNVYYTKMAREKFLGREYSQIPKEEPHMKM